MPSLGRWTCGALDKWPTRLAATARQTARVTSQTAPTSTTTAYSPLRYGVHLLVAVAIGIVSPFTALAWPFALLVGMAIGSADARRSRGEAAAPGQGFFTGLSVILGTLGMLFFGAIIGGIIAIVVVVLAVFSERAAAHASPIDRGVARIILFVVPVVMWFIVFPLLGFNLNVQIGG